jgi:4-diphosphocytidyl-2-C-methyl-D-erythritol kinase
VTDSMSSQGVRASAPAKINLILHVGSPDATGFHPLLTAFQAVDLWDTVTLTESNAMALECRADFDTSMVPRDETNISWRAVELLRAHHGVDLNVSIEIDKSIPVAGGMAGGSADAAATILAATALWDTEAPLHELFDITRALGSDVPFSMVGGQAIGRGRGDVLQSIEAELPLYLVVVMSDGHLSTPEVYRELDRLRDGQIKVPDALSEDFLDAWRRGDADALAPLLHNDLQPAALSLMPALDETMEQVRSAGALAAIVSGSGPSVIGLARSVDHAQELEKTLRSLGLRAISTKSTPKSAHLRQDPAGQTGSQE